MSLKITKPMKAEECPELEKLNYPCFLTPKIDGIRCLKRDGKALSSTFKPIPNEYVRTQIEKYLPDGIDGEIITVNEDGNLEEFNDIQSKIMSRGGEPLFRFVAFDYVKDELNVPYLERTIHLRYYWEHGPGPLFLEALFPEKVESPEEFRKIEEMWLAKGFEGVMVRSGDGPYKCGRSTVKEGFLLKRKPFEDSEAEIIGLEEAMTNTNAVEKNELGHTKRSSKKAGMVSSGTLGKFLVRDIKTGVEFGIGTGKALTKALKKQIWDNQSDYLGKIITYSYQKVGMKDKARIPSFKGFRHKDDVTE
jgi:DNA ligase-1